MFVFLFFQGFQERQEVKVLVVAVLPHPPRPNIVIYFLGESTTLWTHIVMTRKKVYNSLFCKDGFLCVWMLCVRRCWNQVLFLKSKCFSFLFSLMQELYAIYQSWSNTQVLPLAVSQLFSFLFLKSEINKLLLPVASPHSLSEHVLLFASLNVCRSKPEGLPPSLPTRHLIGWLTPHNETKGNLHCRFFHPAC